MYRASELQANFRRTSNGCTANWVSSRHQTAKHSSRYKIPVLQKWRLRLGLAAFVVWWSLRAWRVVSIRQFVGFVCFPDNVIFDLNFNSLIIRLDISCSTFYFYYLYLYHVFFSLPFSSIVLSCVLCLLCCVVSYNCLEIVSCALITDEILMLECGMLAIVGFSCCAATWSSSFYSYLVCFCFGVFARRSFTKFDRQTVTAEGFSWCGTRHNFILWKKNKRPSQSPSQSKIKSKSKSAASNE